MILDDSALERRFASVRRIPEILRTLAIDAGAVPIADYAWEVAADAGVVRHLRRMTPIGLISVREDAPSAGGQPWAVRAQIVTLQQAVDIAIVRREAADGEGFWELHVGDGNPQPVREPDLPAAFALVRAALEATRPWPGAEPRSPAVARPRSLARGREAEGTVGRARRPGVAGLARAALRPSTEPAALE